MRSWQNGFLIYGTLASTVFTVTHRGMSVYVLNTEVRCSDELRNEASGKFSQEDYLACPPITDKFCPGPITTHHILCSCQCLNVLSFGSRTAINLVLGQFSHLHLFTTPTSYEIHCHQCHHQSLHKVSILKTKQKCPAVHLLLWDMTRNLLSVKGEKCGPYVMHITVILNA